MAEPIKPELVLLLHGIGSAPWFLKPLAHRLQADGFQTKLWSYFTLHGSNQKSGEKLAAEVRRLAESGEYSRVHIAAHSMGSIVTRCMLTTGVPEKLGRVVMIGPPNRGSHVAKRLIRWYRVPVRALVELQDTHDSFVNQLPPAPQGVEIGVLAASLDRMVVYENTFLDGQADHFTLRGHHTAVLWTKQCADQVAHFLREGSFLRPQETPAPLCAAS